MANDVVISIGVDNDELKKGLKQSSKILDKFARKKRKTRATERREKKREVATETLDEIGQLRKRLKENKRFDRKRARNRLKAFKLRIREEARLEKVADRARNRAEKDRAKRRAKLDRVVGRVGRGSARAVGFGVAAAGLNIARLFDAREALGFERSLALLAGQADISASAQANLGNAITQTSLAFGAFRGDVLRGVEAVVEKSGDLQLATDIISTMSKAAIGLDADLGDLGKLAAALGVSFKISGKDMEQFFNILIAQGDKGQITLKDFARIAEEVFGTAAGFGVKGKTGVNAISALIQAGVGSAEERKTSIVSFLEQLTAKEKKITDLGVEVRGPKGPKGQQGELRNVADILQDIIRVTGGNLGKINKIFSGAALKPFLISAAEFRETKKFGSLKKFLGAGAGSEGLIDKRFQRVAATASVSFDKFNNLITVLGEKTIAPVLTDFAMGLNELLQNPEQMKALSDGFVGMGRAIKAVALVTADLITVFGKLFNFVDSAVTLFSSGAATAPSSLTTRGGSGRTGANQTIVKNTFNIDSTRKSVRGVTVVEQINADTGLTTRTHTPVRTGVAF